MWIRLRSILACIMERERSRNTKRHGDTTLYLLYLCWWCIFADFLRMSRVFLVYFLCLFVIQGLPSCHLLTSHSSLLVFSHLCLYLLCFLSVPSKSLSVYTRSLIDSLSTLLKTLHSHHTPRAQPHAQPMVVHQTRATTVRVPPDPLFHCASLLIEMILRKMVNLKFQRVGIPGRRAVIPGCAFPGSQDPSK